MVTEGAAPGPDYLDALTRVLRDDTLDPAFRAYALRLPSEDDMAQTIFDAGITPDPTAIHAGRERLAQTVAEHLRDPLSAAYSAMHVPGPYTPDARAAGARALRLQALSYLTRIDGGARAQRQFAEASNMTEEIGALGCLLTQGLGQPELATFARRWGADRLVMDKWFSLQVLCAAPEQTAAITEELTAHRDFDWKNPNRFRAVLGALSGNTAGFHDPSGASYRLAGRLADPARSAEPADHRADVDGV